MTTATTPEMIFDAIIGAIASGAFAAVKARWSPMTKAASKFPTAYIRMADWVETGNDLENTETNAIIGTLQLDVIANTSLNDCKEVVYESVNILKSLRFNIVGMPIYTSNENLFTGVIRFRRVIGNGESL